jgi:BlaI family transcriptional regulator, penicillinase repressor
MAEDRPSLSKSELEIARVVWELGEATVRQVHEALPAEREVDFWTVQTFLRRLKEKGYLNARRVGTGNIYSPAVQPQRVIRELMDDFVDRLFDGEVVPLFQHLVNSRGLTDAEIQQLQAHLNELKAKKK